MDVGFGPVHDLAEFGPVVHLFKVQVLHRRAGDDETVIVGILYGVEGGVEGFQVAAVHVLGAVAHGAQQFHLDLQGGVGKFPQELGLRDDLRGHQVQDQEF